MAVRGMMDFDMAQYSRRRAYSAGSGFATLAKNKALFVTLYNAKDSGDDLHVRLRRLWNIKTAPQKVALVVNTDLSCIPNLVSIPGRNLWTGEAAGAGIMRHAVIDNPARLFPGVTYQLAAFAGTTDIATPRVVPPGSNAGLLIMADAATEVSVSYIWVEGDPLD